MNQLKWNTFYALLSAILWTSCTSQVEGTWALDEWKIVIDQSLDDPNMGEWIYYQGDEVIHDGEYVYNPEMGDLGFTTLKGDIFLGRLRGDTLLFHNPLEEKEDQAKQFIKQP